MHQFKTRPPRLQPDDSWDDLTVLTYEGYRENERYANRKRAHHYKVRCACGHTFIAPQSRLYGKNRMRHCSHCGEKYRIERVCESTQRKPQSAKPKQKPKLKPQSQPKQTMLHWPVPGSVRR